MIYDIAIIGAGPAGMSAAISASNLGMHVVVLDLQSRPGGQIYRNENGEKVPLIADFLSSNAVYLPGSYVWQVTAEGIVTYSINGYSEQLHARTILIATGAMERPTPTPGWTLPGVMTVGAAQIMLKQSKMLPRGKVWIVGSGPLAMLYAKQAQAEGLKLEGILDTAVQQPFSHWLKLVPLMFNHLSDLMKGAELKYQSGKAKRLIRNVSDYQITGDQSVTGIRYCVRGKWQTVDADTVLVHQGIIPNLSITRMLNIKHAWDSNAACFKPCINAQGQSTEDRIFVAGDGAGIRGAEAAILSGQLVTIRISHYLNKNSYNHRKYFPKKLINRLNKLDKLHHFLQKTYHPLCTTLYPEGETLVCRCEGVSAKHIDDAMTHGATGPRMVKAMTRCGMGLCQGRMCSTTLTNLMAKKSDICEQEIDGLPIRSPLRPINISEFVSVKFNDKPTQE